MCRRILRPKQVPLLWVLLGVVLFSVLAAPMVAKASDGEIPDNHGATYGVKDPVDPEDGSGGGGSGSGEGDPDDPIIDLPEVHKFAVKLILLFTIYLP